MRRGAQFPGALFNFHESRAKRGDRATGSALPAEETMKRLFFAFAFSVVTSGAFASGLSVSFEWGPTKRCFDPKSPPIKLSGVPQGTAKLQITMTDSSSAYDHGGGTVVYKGQTLLQYGAFRYKGPCPDSGTHFYNITVKALAASGSVLASGSASRPFTAK